MSRSDSSPTRRTILKTIGGAGVGLAASGTASAQETTAPAVEPDWGNWFTDQARGGEVDNYDGTTVDRRGESEVTVLVGSEGNGGYFAFDPPALWIDPGTTVIFEWTGEGGGHNVVSESGPAGMDSGAPIAEAGVHFEHTFEATGINTYYCVPHLALGMKAGIAVGEDIPTVQVAPPGEAEPGFSPPGGIAGFTLMLLMVGFSAVAAFGVLAGESVTSLRRPAGEPEELAEAEPYEPAREIGHDEFDPIGTASLIVIYFAILVIMWIFVYFIEFLGRGPTVIG